MRQRVNRGAALWYSMSKIVEHINVLTLKWAYGTFNVFTYFCKTIKIFFHKHRKFGLNSTGCENEGKNTVIITLYNLQLNPVSPQGENISKSSLRLGTIKNKCWPQHELFPAYEKHLYYKLFSVSKRKNKSQVIWLSDHGSLPLTHWCCSIRLLRSMSMCLARSQLSLVREVCPRLRDSNLPTESQSDTSHSNTSQLEEMITPNTVIIFSVA